MVLITMNFVFVVGVGVVAAVVDGGGGGGVLLL